MMNNAATAFPQDAEQPVIVCVDDEPKMLGALERLLASLNAPVATFEHPEDALAYMQDHAVSVILSDMRMPGVSGAEFLSQSLRLQPDVYRILMTGYTDLKSTVAAINDGHVQRYLSKPWSNENLLGAVKTGLETYRIKAENDCLHRRIRQQKNALEQQVEYRTRQLRAAIKTLRASNYRNEDAYQGTLRVLFNALSVSPVADGHFLKNVSTMATLLAAKCGLDESQVQQVRLAGLLVNLGLLGVDPTLLHKGRTRFRMTVQEKNELARHPQIAQTILAPATHFDSVARIIGCQNEWFNGGGRPLGLSGDEIPIESRVLTIARDFCKIIYSSELALAAAIKKGRQQMLQGMNNRYDPELVEVLLNIDLDELSHFETKHYGKTVDALEPGMILVNDLYNSAGLLLLPKGAVLTASAIQKLVDYQDGNDEVLQVQAEETPEGVDALSDDFRYEDD